MYGEKGTYSKRLARDFQAKFRSQVFTEKLISIRHKPRPTTRFARGPSLPTRSIPSAVRRQSPTLKEIKETSVDDMLMRGIKEGERRTWPPPYLFNFLPFGESLFSSSWNLNGLVWSVCGVGGSWQKTKRGSCWAFVIGILSTSFLPPRILPLGKMRLLSRKVYKRFRRGERDRTDRACGQG